ncbi:MAG TPA: YhjD/YihY/BrkB family envelope integrity protein [Candidatus Binataceae bacterium]|nr:YhjD/YihY/BrkB family envelope integrity protein [Candidatus Binataceae bacterium]
MANNNNHARTSFRERLYGRLSVERARADLDRLERLTHRGTLGVLRAAVIGFNNHNDLLWASALTFTFSLSLIPMLAVALSALSGLGLVGHIEPIITQYLAVNSPVIAAWIMSFVSNVNAQTLGAVGGVTLLITVVLTLSTVEQALNVIFNVSLNRPWMRKFTDYLSVTFTVPLLLAVAVPLKTRLATELPHFPGIGWIAATIPIWAGFTFLYLFFPNTHVRWTCAAIGGFVAAVLLEFGQLAYINSQVSAAQYRAIYGALAAVPVLLTWIYIAWIIILAGAEITAAAQGIEPAFTIDYRSPAFVRTVALLAVFRAGQRMRSRGANSCSVNSLAAEMGVPVTAIRPVIDQLAESGIIIESGDKPPREGIFLARDSTDITLAETLGAFYTTPENVHGDERISSLLKGLNDTEQEAMSRLTVRDLICGRFEPHRHARMGVHTNPEPEPDPGPDQPEPPERPLDPEPHT